MQADPKTGRPQLVNSLICDKLTSMTAAQSISSALVARERSGVGQRIDVSMLDSALFFMWPDAMLNYTFIGDESLYTWAASHAGMIRQTSDGFICTMPVQQDEWLGLFAALKLPNLIEDPQYHTETGINMIALNVTLDAAFASFTTAELDTRLEQHQVPFARVNARDEVVNDPQVVARESLWEFEHPFAGPMRQARPPARYSKTPAALFRPSPELGEHTAEVLAEAGVPEEKIAALRSNHTIR